MVLQSPDVTTVEVPLGERSYEIQIAESLERLLEADASGLFGELTHALVIADQGVAERWAPVLTGRLVSQGIRVSEAVVPAGETSKSIEQYDHLLRWALAENADRQSIVFAFGGGVVGDLAGFVAATFARGIRLLQLPTTLLAMVDSSVGGKTGINLPAAKNMVGAFWQPSRVLIATEVLATLPPRIYRSGLAEVIKYGVIDDADFFGWLEGNAAGLVNRDPDSVRRAILESCRSKARVVGADERETSGRRAILNYGHTFAHAIEATAGYGKLLHGEAVAIGMQMAARLAIAIGRCSSGLLERQSRLIEACGLPTSLDSADPDAMLPVMKKDKKVAHGNLRFILPAEIGRVELVGNVDPAAVREAIEATRG